MAEPAADGPPAAVTRSVQTGTLRLLSGIIRKSVRGSPGAGSRALAVLFMAFFLALPAGVGARVLEANPDNYRELAATLAPGDTLNLAPGEYRRGLALHGVHGTRAAPIVIQGPAQGEPAVLVARRGAHTISILDASHIHVRDLRLEGRGMPVSAVRLEGHARYGHHITLERLTIVGHGANQQVVGISTKAPAWGWIIRGNSIHGAGTGMYLGNSDGSAPFFDGLIEHNLVTAPIGYAIQIKHQHDRPTLDNAPRGRHVTVIRHNVLSKAEGGASGAMARPNLLLGHFPRTGEGARDDYHVYGNFLDENPHEALIQAEGNAAFYANVLRNRHGRGIAIQPHNDVPRDIRIIHNTVITSGEPIAIRIAEHTPPERQVVHANAVFSPFPIRGGVQSDNAVFGLEEAGALLAAAHGEAFNPYPASEALRCPAAAEPTFLKELTNARCDFNGEPRRASWCGAYAGNGRNPGWLPATAIKPRTQCRAR